MNREQAIKIIKDCKEKSFNRTLYTLDEYQAATDMAIKALEQEPDAIHNEREQAYMKGYEDSSKRFRTDPCGDAISRQAAIDAMATLDWQELYLPIHFKQLLEDLPPVSTEKTGRWEFVQYGSNPNIGNWHCSECNRIVCGAITAASPVYSYKYCPNCGAKMGAEE